MDQILCSDWLSFPLGISLIFPHKKNKFFQPEFSYSVTLAKFWLSYFFASLNGEGKSNCIDGCCYG